MSKSSFAPLNLPLRLSARLGAPRIGPKSSTGDDLGGVEAALFEPIGKILTEVRDLVVQMQQAAGHSGDQLDDDDGRAGAASWPGRLQTRVTPRSPQVAVAN